MYENRTIEKPPYIRDLGKVDITMLEAWIMKIPDAVWTQEDRRKENKFACFHHTRHMIFRFIEGNRDHRVFYANLIWQVWQSMLLPVLDHASSSYDFQENIYPKVMLARLAAGYDIDRHVDGAGANLYTHKIHIPIKTNEKIRVLINDQPFHLKAGNAYEVNNIVPHAVENPSSEDRIHLIFEVFDGANSSPP